MSTQILTELPNIQYAGMDYNSVMEEIRKIIKDNPNWSENWESFHSSEAGVMFIQIMSWICDNLSTRQDTLYNEQYLSTAQKKSSKIRLLKSIGYKPALAHAAQVQLNFEFNDGIPEKNVIVLKGASNEETLSTRVKNIPKLKGKDINGQSSSWEILPLTGDRPNYLDGITLGSGSGETNKDINDQSVFALQGETKYEEMKVTTSDGIFLNIKDKNVADNSIRVYIKSTRKECQEVNSFVSKEAVDEKYGIPYIIEYNEDETLKIRFASKDVLKDERRLKAGDSIFVFYRVTNGKLGNIPPRFINTTYIFSNEDKNKISTSIYNDTLAYNGSDNEELNKAVLNAPLTLRTLDRAVTPEDFDILINANQSVLKSKTYTASNIPNRFKEYFGRHINPQEAFIFTLLNKSYKSVPTKEYNNFPWINLNKMNMLNEEYSFGKGKINEKINFGNQYNELKVNIDDGDFSNGIIIDFGQEFNNNVLNLTDKSGFKLKINSKKTIEKVFNKIPYDLINDGDLGSLEFTNLTDNKDIKKDTNARFVSKESFDKNKAVNLKDCHYLTINMDNRVSSIINLWDEKETKEGEDFYLYWDNVPKTETVVKNDGSEAQAINRNGIIQLINKQFVPITNGDGNMSGNMATADIFNESTAYQYMGLDDVSEDDIFINFIDDKDYDFTIKISEINFDFKISKVDNDNKDTLTYGGFIDILNKYLKETPNENLFIFNDNGNIWIPIETYNKIETNKKINTSNLSFKITNSVKDTAKKDIYLKSTNNELFIDGNKIKVSDISSDVSTSGNINNISIIHKLHGKGNEEQVLLGENFEAVSYNNIAEMIADKSSKEKYYFQLKSPVIGHKSCVYFSKSVDLGDDGKFVIDILKTRFPNNAKTETFRAYGIKRIRIIDEQIVGIPAYVDIDGKSSFITESINVGNLIFENSCIYNDYDFSDLYGSYKFEDLKRLKIGSVYNNFYYTGDKKVDDSIKEKEYKFSKPTGVVYDKNEEIDLNRSNIEIKFTNYKVDNNSFYSIKDDDNETSLNLIRSDNVEISTPAITDAKFTTTLKFSLDNIPKDKAWEVSLEGSTGTDLVNAIKDEIKNSMETGDIIYKPFINNLNSIIKNNYFAYNSVQFLSLSKNDGNVTFYYSGVKSKEDENANKEFYKTFLGTNKTNSKLYELYPKDSMDEKNVITETEGEYYYAPTFEKELIFEYRKIVNGISKPADYYITYDEPDFYINKTEKSEFTDGVFYTHIINDRTGDLGIDGNPIVTDENNLNDYMKNKKISGMDFVWLQPYIRTYDIAADVYYNANFSQDTIKSKVEESVKKLCSIENAEIGGYMSQSKINKAIMDCDGVSTVTFKYFGYNYKSGMGDEKELRAKFYEILCLSDTDEDSKSHGLILNYKLEV